MISKIVNLIIVNNSSMVIIFVCGCCKLIRLFFNFLLIYCDLWEYYIVFIIMIDLYEIFILIDE